MDRRLFGIMILGMTSLIASAASGSEQWPSVNFCNWGCQYNSYSRGGHDPSKVPLTRREKDEVFPANAGSVLFKTRHALDVYKSSNAIIEGAFRLEQGRRVRALELIPDRSGIVFDDLLGEGYVVLADDGTF